MESTDYEKSKYYCGYHLDSAILEKSGLANECKWKAGHGIQDSPHVHEKYLRFFIFLGVKRS
jgi:hypothetical protein